MTQAMKVYQIAEALGMDYDIVVAKIRAFGIQVNNKMSKIDGEVAEQIKSSLLKDKQQDWIEIDMGNGVRKRVRKSPPAAAAPPPPAPEPVRARETPAPARPVEEPAVPPAVTPPPAPTVSAETSAPAPTPAESKPAAPPATAAPTPPAPAPVHEPATTAAAPSPATTSARETHQPAPPPAAEAKPAVREPAPTPAVSESKAAPAPREEPARAAEAPARKPTPAPAPTAAQQPAASAPVSAPAPTPAPVVEAAPAVRETAPPAQPVAAATAAETPAPTSSAPSAPPASSGAAASGAQQTAATGARPGPSIPPPKTGTVVWDPVTKTMTHLQSNTPSRPSRSVQVDQSRISPQGMRPRTGAGGPAGRPMGPGMRPGIPGRPRPGLSGGRMVNRGPAPPPSIMGAHKRVVKIEGQINLQELARRMSVKASDVLFKLLGMGMTGVNINSTLDADTAKLLAQEFQYDVEDVAVAEDDALKAIVPDFKDNPGDYVARPPVVTVMGHVDHGKTTLLDAILGMRVAEGEAGGITQKVSAYRVETPKGPVVFFDTPGHEAFTKLRARGAETTDVAVLVVAADDGVMPTTVEAINHVKAAGVPIVVALNKMDKPDAKPDRVLQQLMEHEVVAEQFGGETLVVRVSAKQRTGIDELVETLALQSEILDLKANPKRPGVGTVFDATLDKGRGVVTRMLVQDGTVRAGDVVLAGQAYGKIRAMFDDRGKAIAKAGPSTPVEILGLNEVPNAGDSIYVVQDIKKAQSFADERRLKAGPIQRPGAVGTPGFPDINALLSAGETITVGIIIKAEAQASVEALSKALTELSTDKVKIQTVHTGIGAITESDVNLAVASKAVIIGFNVRPQGKTTQLAESEKVQIRLYNIIYEAVDDIKLLMVGQLKPTFVEKALGKAEVRQVFNITKVGQIAGSYVTEGKFIRTARARLVRDSVQIWEGKLASLKRFKDDIREVGTGFECGIGLENYNDIKPGDVIEAFELEEVAAKL